MRPLKVGAAVLNQTPLDWGGNLRRIQAAIKQAEEEGVQVLCLPEMCITGYGCEDHFHSRDVQERAWTALQVLCGINAKVAFSVGLPVLYRNALFNCTAMVAPSDGLDGVKPRVLGLVAKQHLAGDGIHYEPRWFKPWPKGVVDRHDEGMQIGDLIFNLDGVRVGFEVCEDAWVANRPGADLARRGVDIILNPSASHFAFDKFQTRKRFVIEGSRAFACTYVYANLLGNESGRAIYDGGALIATAGHMVQQGPRFTYDQVLLTSAVVDVDKTKTIQARTASFMPQLGHQEGEIWNELPAGHKDMMPPVRERAFQKEWEESRSDIKEQEFTRAIALALFDYSRKSGSSGFALSLSGGADSAACAVLVHAMAHLSKKRAKPLGDILTCVYQKTRNSSDVTETAAREVAKEVGANFIVLDVDSLVEGYTKLVAGGLNRDLTWGTDDLALQNIQARVRSPSVWMIANILNALLLSTSNRSEAAVGYCTMDGDTSGSISPIAGIDKNFLQQWLRWAQTEKPPFPPVMSLRLVTEQAPTAELRPASENQTDEKDLMPYDILDFIQKAAIRDKMSPIDVFKVVKVKFQFRETTRFGEWVEKFFRLWARNQWKRERYAPSFHVDDEDLDPRAWCRFPILSGGFELELAALREYVKNENPSAPPEAI